jgi:uncharacterized membrane-anchored protein
LPVEKIGAIEASILMVFPMIRKIGSRLNVQRLDPAGYWLAIISEVIGKMGSDVYRIRSRGAEGQSKVSF